MLLFLRIFNDSAVGYVIAVCEIEKSIFLLPEITITLPKNTCNSLKPLRKRGRDEQKKLGYGLIFPRIDGQKSSDF